MKKICLILVYLTLFLNASNDQGNNQNTPKESIKAILEELKTINQTLNNDENPWVRRHSSYVQYDAIVNEIKTIEWKLKHIKASEQNTEEIKALNTRLETLQRQKKAFADYEGNPYRELIDVKEIGEIPSITNPIAIFSGLNFIKQIKNQEKTLENNQKTLQNTLDMLDKKKTLLTQLLNLQDPNKQYETLREIQKVQSIKNDLLSAQSILETSLEIFSRRVSELDLNITNQIHKQAFKIINLLIACVIVFLIALAIKIGLRKYLEEEKLYIANKVINFTYITLIALILLLSYLSNITYLITFLGFVSAGLAFAMRDLFMSVLGWFVIVIGGSLHAGDRIRIHKDNTTYVGDILDISMTNIILLEDVTLNTYLESRRAGRIVFIPNNYIFNTVISNYTHGGMTTVWDGIDFTITFDSNHKKAIEIATEVARKYSKSHIETGKKRMAKLKERYSLKRISLEPRIFSLIEPNGLRISIWYQTNSFTTLNVRSNISSEIIDLIAKEQDIKLSYPTTKIVNTGSDGVWERFTQEGKHETKSVF